MPKAAQFVLVRLTAGSESPQGTDVMVLHPSCSNADLKPEQSRAEGRPLGGGDQDSGRMQHS